MNAKENVLPITTWTSILEKYLKTRSFEILNCQETKLFTCTEKLNACYFLIKIKIRQEKIPLEITFIGKKAASDEVIFYKNILQEIGEFNDVSCCLKSYLTQTDDVIVFEDFFSNGFAFHDKPNQLDASHVKLTIRALAKLHAASLIYESNKSEVLEGNFQLTDVYKNLKSDNKALDNSWFKAEIKQLKNVIEFLTENNLIGSKLNDRLNDVVNSAVELVKTKKLKKVLCHGNLEGKNVLFKYHEAHTPIDCKLINFEFPQYNPPVVDLLQFIFMATTSEMRQQMLDEFVDFYYACLKKEVKVKNLEINTIIPYKEDFEVSVYNILPFIKLYTTCLKLFNNFQNKNDVCEDKFCYKDHLTELTTELEQLIKNKSLMLEDIFKIVKSKLKTADYILLNYTFKPLGEISGYMGDHNKLIINVKTKNENKTLLLFAKFMPRGRSQLEIANDMNAFPKEIFMYQKLFSEMRNAGIDLINDCVVPCHFTRHDQVLVFDDFGAVNYKSLDPRVPYSYQLIQLVIKKLAKFHAASLIFEENIRKKTNKQFNFNNCYPEIFEENLLARIPGHQASRVIETGIKAIEHCLNLFNQPSFAALNPGLIEKIMKAYDFMFEAVKPSKTFRNVICHGDLWGTNMLVQCENDEFTDCRFIDFQIARYCPPAHDLLTLIYINTNKALRKAHLEDLIKLYYDELGENLHQYGYNINDLIPHESFLESIDYMIPEAVAQTAMYFQLVLINPTILKEYMSTEDTVKEIMIYDRRDFITVMFKNDTLFRERLKEGLDDLIEVSLKYL